MKKTNATYYYPFCSESYWPTAYDAIQEMRERCRFDSGIMVYPTYDDARHIAETTVMDDETWIVIEVNIVDGKASASVYPNDGGWVEDDVDDYLIQHFNVQLSQY